MKLNYTIVYFIINWLFIGAAILVAHSYPIIYPVAFIIIANRQFANYLIGHEGIHGLIVKNRFLNSFIGKYLCLFPVFVSFETYRTYHLMHHEFLGTHLDPDKKLYDFYPIKRDTYLKNVVAYFLTLQMIRDFFIYFTPFYSIIKSRNWRKIFEGDCLEYIFFNAIVLIMVIMKGWVILYLQFWVLPLLLLIPYYYFVSALQHGLIYKLENSRNSRNIVGQFLLMEILLPCGTHMHGVHHEYPQVPFYNLKKVYAKKEMKSTSYLESVGQLLPKRNP